MICGIGEVRGGNPDGRCQAWYRLPAGMSYCDIRCLAPPDITVTVGCVHEHVRTFEVCEKCMAAVAAESGCDWLCGWCHYGDSPHECEMPITGEKRLEKS